ncbi:sensor histidine kinase [Paenibacillus puldeungensis]|uniref:Sensor histidine kinase n=1 Tax=Paenibacillus puldeungensis TaxID=696536 RepID=A0ABW3S021_9BACL
MNIIGNGLLEFINRIFGFISPIFAMFVVEWFLPIRRKGWAKPLLYIGCWFFTGMVIFIGDPVNLPGTLLGFGAVLFLCCEGTWLQRLSITLILSSLGLSSSALVDSNYYLFDIGYLFRFTIWLLVFLALKRFAPKQEYHLPPSLWGLVDVLTLTPFAATLITVLLGDPYGRGNEMQDIILLPLVTLSSIGLLWAVVILARQHKLEQEKSFYQLNLLRYENLEQEQFQVRRLRHDMANHLQTMSSLPDQELREYLGQLLHSPAMGSSYRYSDNSIINAVWGAKQPLMEQMGIETEISVTVPAKLSIDGVDLCAVFANSLDNAIEACERLPVGQRTIKVKARADKGMFVLQVQNPLLEPPKKRNGRFATGKTDLAAHGFGLASIEEIARRYDGSVSITTEDGQFTLFLYLALLE